MSDNNKTPFDPNKGTRSVSVILTFIQDSSGKEFIKVQADSGAHEFKQVELYGILRGFKAQLESKFLQILEERKKPKDDRI